MVREPTGRNLLGSWGHGCLRGKVYPLGRTRVCLVPVRELFAADHDGHLNNHSQPIKELPPRHVYDSRANSYRGIWGGILFLSGQPPQKLGALRDSHAKGLTIAARVRDEHEGQRN